MRIVSWNVENVSRCLSHLPAVVEVLKEPDVLCLQELRIRSGDAEAIDALASAVPGYRCHYSLPRDTRNVTFRGGRMYGVASLVKGRWRSELPEWDREGRIITVRRGKLAVVNLYAVNGTSKPYLDESGQAAGTRHDFKRRFQSSLIDLGRELRKKGSVVLLGDWNVTRTVQDTHPRLRTEEPHASARADLNERITAAGFVDIWRERHPADRAYTWFNRRARGLDAARVDYVLVSDDLSRKVRAAEIYGLLPWSDHAPISVEW
jgi:exodeoxyribonuclease III